MKKLILFEKITLTLWTAQQTLLCLNHNQPASRWHKTIILENLLQMNKLDELSTSSTPRVNRTARRINKLAETLKAQNYLEIGVFKGHTFFPVTIPKKTAVDPLFRFELPIDSDCQFFQQTSDTFYAQLAPQILFDFVYIDGLHTFEQTYRDFWLYVNPSG